MFDIDNYAQFRCDRTKRRGGGVSLYIECKYTSEDIPFVSVSKFEFIWRRITDCKNNSFILCASYHPPKTSHTPYKACELLEEIDVIIGKCYVCYPNDYVVLTGDMNSLDLTNLATDHGLVQIVNEPTHRNNIIDNFFTNRPDLFTINLLKTAIKT
jgi:hypothetical protein